MRQGGVRWVGGQGKHHNFLDLGHTGWNDPPGGPASQSTPTDRPGTSDREFQSICRCVERDLGRAAPQPAISHRTPVGCPCTCTNHEQGVIETRPAVQANIRRCGCDVVARRRLNWTIDMSKMTWKPFDAPAGKCSDPEKLMTTYRGHIYDQKYAAAKEQTHLVFVFSLSCQCRSAEGD